LFTLILLAAAAVLLFISVYLITTAFAVSSRLTVAKLVDPAGVVGSFTTPGYGVGLVPWALVVWRQVTTSAPVPLLGLGPGSGGSSAAVQLQTPAYLRYFYDYFHTAHAGLPADLPTQVLQTGAEYGPLGPLLLWAIAAEFYLLARRLRRAGSDPLSAALGAALVVQSVIMVVLSIKDGIWEQQTVAMWLWVLGGLVFIQLRRPSETAAPKTEPGPVTSGTEAWPQNPP
jgi:hypothetical protein